MDDSTSKQGSPHAHHAHVVMLQLCAFCAKKLGVRDHIHLSLESPTGVQFVVHVRCFRNALSEANRHLMDIAHITVR